MTQEQLVTEADEADDDAFDTMMSALDVFFHVAKCPNHSKEERQEALKEAADAFAAYVGYDPLTGPENGTEAAAREVVADLIEKYVPKDVVPDGIPVPNAPTSNKVH